MHFPLVAAFRRSQGRAAGATGKNAPSAGDASLKLGIAAARWTNSPIAAAIARREPAHRDLRSAGADDPSARRHRGVEGNRRLAVEAPRRKPRRTQ